MKVLSLFQNKNTVQKTKKRSYKFPPSLLYFLLSHKTYFASCLLSWDLSLTNYFEIIRNFLLFLVDNYWLFSCDETRTAESVLQHVSDSHACEFYYLETGHLWGLFFCFVFHYCWHSCCFSHIREKMYLFLGLLLWIYIMDCNFCCLVTMCLDVSLAFLC